MRSLAIVAGAFMLVSLISCRREQANDTAGVTDTVPSMTPEPAPATVDTAIGVREFSFDQRQDFTRSIRQQLADIDQQIADLASQAKSRGGAVSDRALTRIRASRRTVDQSLRRVETATTANWEQIRASVTQGVENLDESIQAAQPK